MARDGVQVVDLNYHPREWQRSCHSRRCRFRVLALHRRAGKTELALMELIDAALKFTLPLGGFFYICPQLKQAKSVAWARLKHRLQPLTMTGAVEIREAELTVRFRHNGASIALYGADNPDALRGIRVDGVVIDEVAQIQPQVWTDIIEPALTDRKGWALFIGTPNGVNLFSELFFTAADKADWMAAKWTVYDTDALDPDEVERLRTGTISEASFAREYLCDFAAASDDQLISLTDTEAAAHRTYAERDILSAPRVIGVDPARFGGDRTVIFRRRGLVAFPPKVLRDVDNMTVAAIVSAEIEDWEPDAVFIDSGAGAGIIDRLRQLQRVVVEVPFGGRAMLATQFVNRRTEMWCAMADWIRAGGSIPNDTGLKQELATPVYWFDASGKRVLESKDDIKKRLKSASSPDLADALALTFAAPVAVKSALRKVEDSFRKARRDGHGHDPFAALR